MNPQNTNRLLRVLLGLACGMTLTASASNLAVRYCAESSGYETNSTGRVTKVFNLGTLGSTADLVPTNSSPTITVSANAFGSSPAFRFDGNDILESTAAVKAYGDGYLGMGSFVFVVSRSNISGSSADAYNRAPFAHGTSTSRLGWFVGTNGRQAWFYGNYNTEVNKLYLDQQPDLTTFGLYKHLQTDSKYWYEFRRFGATVAVASGKGAVNSSGKFVLGGFCSGLSWRKPWNGDVAEVRYYTGGMTASEYFKVMCELAATYDIALADGETYDFPAGMLNGFMNDPAALGTAMELANEETPLTSATSGKLTVGLIDPVASETKNYLVYIAHDGKADRNRKWIIAGAKGAHASRLRLEFNGEEFASAITPHLLFQSNATERLVETGVDLMRDGDSLIAELPVDWKSGIYRVCSADEAIAETCEIWYRADKGVQLDADEKVVGWKNSGFLGDSYNLVHAKIQNESEAVSTIQYETAATSFNSQPAVRFVDSRHRPTSDNDKLQYLISQGNVSPEFTKAGHTIFAVMEVEDYRYFSTFFGFDINNTSYRFGLQSSPTWGNGRGWCYNCCWTPASYLHVRPSSKDNWQKRYLLTAVSANRTDVDADTMSLAISENGEWAKLLTKYSYMRPDQFTNSRMILGCMIASWGAETCGRIAEFRYYRHAMSVQEMAAIELELSARYGLPVSTAGASNPADIREHDQARAILGNVYQCGAISDTISSWTDGMLTATIGDVALDASVSNTLFVVAHDGKSTSFEEPVGASVAMLRTYLISSQSRDLPVTLKFSVPKKKSCESYLLMRKGWDESKFAKLTHVEGEWKDGVVSFNFPTGITGGVYKLLRSKSAFAIILR